MDSLVYPNAPEDSPLWPGRAARRTLILAKSRALRLLKARGLVGKDMLATAGKHLHEFLLRQPIHCQSEPNVKMFPCPQQFPCFLQWGGDYQYQLNVSPIVQVIKKAEIRCYGKWWKGWKSKAESQLITTINGFSLVAWILHPTSTSLAHNRASVGQPSDKMSPLLLRFKWRLLVVEGPRFYISKSKLGISTKSPHALFS